MSLNEMDCWIGLEISVLGPIGGLGWKGPGEEPGGSEIRGLAKDLGGRIIRRDFPTAGHGIRRLEIRR